MNAITTQITGRLWQYILLTRFNTPAGALLLLWPTMWGLWLAAEGFPGWKWLGIFVGGVFAMRAFGCAVNDITDRKLDAKVARTQNRPLAKQTIHTAEAVAVAGLFLLVAFILWLQLPTGARWWAVAAVATTILYPFGKRFLSTPQALLGIAFSFSIPLAYATIRDAPPPAEAWLFALANWFWVMAYDTIYAMCDLKDDINAGINSSARKLGDFNVKAIGMLYAAAILLLSVLGLWFWPTAIFYHVALIGAMAWVFRFWTLYRNRHVDSCLLAFRMNHWFGAFVWAGLVSAFA